MAMFVSGSKHRALETQLFAAQLAYNQLAIKHNAKIVEWNALVAKVNARGGEALLSRGVVDGAPQFTAEEIKTLLQLCHPDKHGGKESAVRITQKLLELR